MRKTILIVLCSCAGLLGYPQDKVMNLSKSHNSSRESLYFDFIHIDREFLWKTDYAKSDLIKFKIEKDRTSIRTKVWIQFNDTLLKTQAQKKGVLSKLDYTEIVFVKKINKKEALLLYGKTAKHGVIILKSDSSRLVSPKSK